MLWAYGRPWVLGIRDLGFRGLGFRGLGFRGLGFRVFDFDETKTKKVQGLFGFKLSAWQTSPTARNARYLKGLHPERKMTLSTL